MIIHLIVSKYKYCLQNLIACPHLLQAFLEYSSEPAMTSSAESGTSSMESGATSESTSTSFEPAMTSSAESGTSSTESGTTSESGATSELTSNSSEPTINSSDLHAGSMPQSMLNADSKLTVRLYDGGELTREYTGARGGGCSRQQGERVARHSQTPARSCTPSCDARRRPFMYSVRLDERMRALMAG